ncbi:hypothetical protein [Lactobacillus taiwanensis]|uniref:hypothetical protein n=1 Tax=Lactobacillus taiwanensis TaxID=508451 RepID=UPI001AEBC291|nr:hypothetical protein [Lactobacillus taiwanensis]QTQ40866.1 hypothetical protein H1A07_09310 [Lactobacillus taiwanensis]
MPNKRNKNRKSITIHLSEERQNELNEYLNCQKNLKDSIELAILICKKSFGLRDLATAYQDYSLNHMKMNISDINVSMPEQKQPQQTLISSTPEVSSEKKSQPPVRKKKEIKTTPKRKEPKITKPSENVEEKSEKDKLNPSEINKLFFGGESSDL